MPRHQRDVTPVTPIAALTGKFNPFEYYFAYGYAGSKKVEYASFYKNYMSYKPFTNCYKFVFNTTETFHCGYCSDNDGTTQTELREEEYIVYVKIPDELTIQQCTALFQPINNIPTCYCCAENVKYNIVRYTRISSL